MELDGKTTCINIKKYNLAYIPIPKNCSTSIKNYLYEMLRGEKFKRYKKKNGKTFYIHNYWMAENKTNPNRESIFVKSDATKSFVVIREPIKRYISSFANRVVNHGALGKQNNLTLNDFTNDFETYIKNTRELNHHMAPQSEWICDDLSAFDWVFTTNEIQKMNKIISVYTNTDIEIPRLQTGGPNLNPADLSKKNFYRLIDYYYEDYKTMRDYFTIDSIVNEYKRGNLENKK